MHALIEPTGCGLWRIDRRSLPISEILCLSRQCHSRNLVRLSGGCGRPRPDNYVPRLAPSLVRARKGRACNVWPEQKRSGNGTLNMTQKEC